MSWTQSAVLTSIPQPQDTAEEEELILIKYYLDLYEKEDIDVYISGSPTESCSVAPSILFLLRIYCELRRTSPFFRLKVMQDCEHNRGKITSVPRILYNFLTMHVCTSSHKEFEEKYPCIAEMIFSTTV